MSASVVWVGGGRRRLADLLQQSFLLQTEGNADGHLCDEALAGHAAHLLAVAQVDLTDAAAALEEGERVVRHPVTHWRGGRGGRLGGGATSQR